MIFSRSVGQGPAVLLIHGGSVDSRQWDAQVADLQRDHQVITYDIRGFGGSPRPTEHYRMSDDALAVLDEHGIERAAVVGFSIGSRIALDLAARAPERVAAVAVAAVVPWAPDLSEEITAAQAEIADALQPREEASKRGDLPGAVAADLDVWATAHHGEDRQALAALCMQAPYFFEYRESDDDWYGDLPPVADAALAAFPGPVLAIVGDHEPPLIRLAAEYLMRIVADGELNVFEDADHFMPLSHPERFTAAIRSLLDKAGW